MELKSGPLYAAGVNSRNRPSTKARPEDRILEAATTLVAFHGIAAAGLRPVAEAAQTSLSQVYSHYRTREQLLVAVFQRGWTVIERAIARRIIGAAGPRSLTLGILEGLLDAYSADRFVFSATVILGTETFGHPAREALKSSDGFLGYRSIGTALKEQMRHAVPEEEILDVVEFLFGAVERRFLLLTPLCAETANKAIDFDRERITRVFTRMLDGLLEGCVQRQKSMIAG